MRHTRLLTVLAILLAILPGVAAGHDNPGNGGSGK